MKEIEIERKNGEQESKKSQFIPTDIIISIAEFYEIEEVVPLFSLVNKFWNKIFKMMQFWSIFFSRDFGGEQIQSLKSIEEVRELYLENWKFKNGINLIFLGHVDCGCSTMIGRIRNDHHPNEKKFKEIQKKANENGKGSFVYSWFIDKTVPERQRGITIHSYHSIEVVLDQSKLDESFKTEQIKRLNLIDTPGHCDFLKNDLKTLNCFSNNKSIPIIVVDSSLGAFEAGLSAFGCTIPNIQFAFSHSSKIIVAINKIRFTKTNFRSMTSLSRFNEVKKETIRILRKCGYKPENIFCVPVSGWANENISKRTTAKEWKNFLCLLEVIQLVTDQKRKKSKANSSKLDHFKKRKVLRAVILKERKENDELVVRVFSGSFRTGEKLVFANGNSFVCKSITNYNNRKKLVVAKNGDVVIVKFHKPLDFQKIVDVSWNTIKSTNKNKKKIGKHTVKKGLKRMVIGNTLNPPKYVRVIYGKIVCFNRKTLKEGSSPIVIFGGAQVRIRVLKITEIGKTFPKEYDWNNVGEKEVEELLKKNFKKLKPEEKKILRPKYIGTVIFELLQPTTFETFDDLRDLGRLFIYDNRVVFGGIRVTKILK